MEAERQAREAADKRVEEWQIKARAGEILLSLPYPDLPVFHEILDNENMVGENLKKYGDDYEEEGMHVLDTYCFNHQPWHYRFCRSYSMACQEGELGDVHLSVAIGKVSREDFEKLKENGFIIDDPVEIYR